MAHPEDNQKLVNLAIHQSLIVLQTVLGEFEPIVLLVEPDMDLWLHAEWSRKNAKNPFVFSFAVTNGNIGDHTKSITKKTLQEAKEVYQEIRAAGSWHDYLNNQHLNNLAKTTNQ